MKEKPILFSGPLVRALLDGTKTQTRRLVHASQIPNGGDRTPRAEWCLYGAPGDRLWVRESFRVRYFDDGRPAFAADWTGESADCVPKPKWAPSIHMPRALSRIDLEVTRVRVQRLQDITEEDARAEGVIPSPTAIVGGTHRAAFRKLWDAINGERATWDSNPWVWALDFKRVRP